MRIETGDMEVKELIAKAVSQRERWKASLPVLDKLIIALCIAEHEGSSQRGIDAMERAGEYAVELNAISEGGLP